MATRRLVPVLLAGLLLLLLVAPAAVAAGGHGPGPRAEGGLSTDSGWTGAGEAGTAHIAGPASQGAEAPAGHGDAVRAGHAGIRASTTFGATAVATGTPAREPRPEVSHAPGRQHAAQSGTAGVRAGNDGNGREGGRGRAGSSDGGQHRGPPPAPAPEAAPARPSHEPGDTGRGRKDGTHLPAPTTGETETADPLLLLRFLLVLGFRRVRPGTVLAHPLRQRLHAAIGANPGLDLAGCAAATGANRETLRYHLALLVCCGKIAEETRSGSVRYFPHDPALTTVHRALVHALRNESLAPLLRAVASAPGISRGDLADRLGVAGPSVTRQVQRLVEEGLVEAERCGRSTCYRLTPACAAALGPALAAGIGPAPVPGRASA